MRMLSELVAEPSSPGLLAFSRGLAWAPDGTCLLTAGESGHYHLVEPAQGDWEKSLHVSLDIAAGEAVRDFAWFPSMRSADRVTSVFIGASKGNPLHLHDAFDGSIRATYSPLNALDEVANIYALCLAAPSATSLRCDLIAGGERGLLWVFDLSRPGKLVPHFRGKIFRAHRGLTTSLATPIAGTAPLAVGGSTGEVALIDPRRPASGTLWTNLDVDVSTRGLGVTALSFGLDTMVIGFRGPSCRMQVWDLRRLGNGPLWDLVRTPSMPAFISQQRIGIEVVDDGSPEGIVVSGSPHGSIFAWRLSTGVMDHSCSVHVRSPDACSAVAVHPQERSIIASVHGSRRSSDEESTERENSLKIWHSRCSVGALAYVLSDAGGEKYRKPSNEQHPSSSTKTRRRVDQLSSAVAAPSSGYGELSRGVT